MGIGSDSVCLKVPKFRFPLFFLIALCMVQGSRQGNF
jgi:hypothetical protein